MDPRRAQVYRAIFALAAAYNLVAGVWAALLPGSFFDLFALAPPRYPSIWATLGMVLALYGVGYAYAARRLDRAAPFIAIGLAGKLLGPIGWVAAVASGELPARTLPLIVFDDVVWWVPFGLFLAEPTRLGARVRAAAPYLALLANLAAALALLLVLAPGTPVEPSGEARAWYVASHLFAWRAGWATWIAAALSLLGLYAWWAARLERRGLALGALAVAVGGLAADLAAESLLIGWSPESYAEVAPRAFWLTGFAANGLYTVAGALLTAISPGVRRSALAWCVWASGFALSAGALIDAPPVIAASTALLFGLFPWFCLSLARRLG